MSEKRRGGAWDMEARNGSLSHYWWRCNFDGLVNGMSARFLTCWVAIIFHLCVGAIFWDYLNIQFFVKLRPSSFFSHWSFLLESVIPMMVAKWCLSSYIIPSTLILRLYCEEELPFTSPHLPVYLYQHWVMDSLSSGGTGCFKIPPDLPWPPLLGSAIYPRIPSSFWVDNCCS